MDITFINYANKIANGENFVYTKAMKIKAENFGAVVEQGRTTFRVFAPYAKEVKLRLYADDLAMHFDEAPLKNVGRGCFGASVEKDLSGFYYTYVVDGVETVDPYAKSTGANSKRGYIFVEGSLDPEGFDSDVHVFKPPIVWEVHVRDFSSDASLALPDAGKFSAFKTGVKTKDGRPALVDYLKYLGVTYVQLMPVMDFGSVDELKSGYNWGYDPMLYFSPEGSYSSDPHDARKRVTELKSLIMTLHREGIGVILDVVFNHTYKKKGNALNVCAPDYYYRMDGSKPADGSGCGNETRSESPMFFKLMEDCVTYLAKNYHVDGFRFDLMGLHDVDCMNRLRASLDNLYEDGSGKNILTYGEGWYWQPPFGVSGADKRHIGCLNERIGMFNDVTRDGLRGGNSDGKGYVQGNLAALDDVMSGLSGGAFKSADCIKFKAPTQQVLYAACHDNYTLFDKLSLTSNKKDTVRMQKMTAFMLMSGVGIPFLQAGEEFLRTKGMDDNSYKSGDEINKLDWSRMSKNWGIVNYYRQLIKIRQSNRIFEDLNAAKESFEFLTAPSGAVAYKIGDVIYAVNNTENDFDLNLTVPHAVLADIDRADIDGLGVVSGAVKVKAHGVLALRKT